jgi:hypothetical protein
MNSAQKQNVANAIQEFYSVEKQFEEIAAKKYKNEQSLDTIIIQDYSLTEIITFSREIVNKISVRIEQDNWQILPNMLVTHEFGMYQLHQCINEMKIGLTRPNYDYAIQRLKALISYATTNGFWNAPQKIELGIRESSLTKLEERAQLTMEHIDERAKTANATIAQLNEKVKELNQLIAQKQQEFATLQNNQTQSNNLLNNITNFNKNAESFSTTIEQTKNKCNEILADLEKKQEKVTQQQNDIDKQIELANTNIQEFETNSKEKIDSIQSGYDSVSANVEEVRKMMGYIADGTLSHSFNQRKNSIKKSKNIWMWVSLVTLVLLIAWVCVVFILLSANTGIVWADILINGIKATPLACAFGFALSEYGKERNMLEEYAFREAVAVTLTAYLEQLNGNNTEEQKNLLVNTVEKLYTKPIISAKEYKLFNFDTKDIAKTAEKVKEIAK